MSILCGSNVSLGYVYDRPRRSGEEGPSARTECEYICLLTCTMLLLLDLLYLNCTGNLNSTLSDVVIFSLSFVTGPLHISGELKVLSLCLRGGVWTAQKAAYYEVTSSVDRFSHFKHFILFFERC